MLQSLCLLVLLVGMAVFAGRLYRNPISIVRLALAITIGFIVGIAFADVKASADVNSQSAVITATSPILHSLTSVTAVTEEQMNNVVGQDVIVGDTVITSAEEVLTMPKKSEIEDDS